MQKVNIFWFRRDLRLHDNAGLYYALKGEYRVIPVFIFDKIILDKLEDKKDRRVEFIQHTLIEMQDQLIMQGSSLEVYYGTPVQVFRNLLAKFHMFKRFLQTTTMSPMQLNRDAEINNLLAKKSIKF